MKIWVLALVSFRGQSVTCSMDILSCEPRAHAPRRLPRDHVVSMLNEAGRAFHGGGTAAHKRADASGKVGTDSWPQRQKSSMTKLWGYQFALTRDWPATESMQALAKHVQSSGILPAPRVA
eukprot:2264847-Amphidinium_carterae.1